MTADVPALAKAIRGVTVNGVPFLALPPDDPASAKALIILWHGADPPRTEEALAAAVPLSTVPAWRVYLGMPGHGARTPPGGFEEIMRLAAEDAITLVYQPRIEGALAELPEALNDVRTGLGIDSSLPMGIFGFSQGGAAALLAVSRQVLPLKAAATYGAVVDMIALIDTLSSCYGMSYEWTPERKALAEQMSTVHRADALAASGAALLLAAGAADPLPVQAVSEELAEEIRTRGGTAEYRVLPDLPHGFVDEPGEQAATQGTAARTIDDLISSWFLEHLV